MRTAITVGKNKAGEWVFLSDLSVPVHKQRDEFKALQSKPNDEFVEIQLWESGSGVVKTHRFRQPVAFVAPPAPVEPAESTEPAPTPAPPAPVEPASRRRR